jgi:hypothetical protein
MGTTATRNQSMDAVCENVLAVCQWLGTKAVNCVAPTALKEMLQRVFVSVICVRKMTICWSSFPCM